MIIERTINYTSYVLFNYALSAADAEFQIELEELTEVVMKTVYETFQFALPLGFRLSNNQPHDDDVV